MLEFLWSCMVIGFKGMIGTFIWFFVFLFVLMVIGLCLYPFTKKKKEIEVKERPDDTPPPSEPTETVSLGDLKDKTIH